MSVWLSGVVFLLCCHVQSSDAAESCPLARMGIHCDKAEKAKDSERITKQTNDDGIDCCAFIPLIFDKTRTADSHQQLAFAPVLSIEIVPTFVATHALPTVTISQITSTVLLKNDTFLKNLSLRL